MKRRTFLGAVGGLAVLGGGGFLGYELFAPEQATEVNENRLGDADTATSGGEATGSATASGAESTTMDSMEDGGTATTGGDSGGATALKRGEFTGKDGHECSGTVTLAEDDQGYFLQFEDYEMTQGPDVFCYVTPAADPDTGEEIGAGTKVRIDGGADGGELTKTGTFAQSLPDGVDVDALRGVAAWCDDFSVPFGAATLDDL